MTHLLGSRIKEARKKVGFTQEELAKRLGIAGKTLNTYERGHRIPDAELLYRLVKEVNCDSGWLLTGEGEMVREWSTKGIEGYGIRDDVMMQIVKILNEHPVDKIYVLDLLRTKHAYEKVLEYFKTDEKPHKKKALG